MSKLICGCGYLGFRVARQWVAAGDLVWVTTRSPQKAAEFAKFGLRPIVGDLTQQFALPAEMGSPSTVLFALGFDASPGQSQKQVYVRSLQNVLDGLMASQCVTGEQAKALDHCAAVERPAKTPRKERELSRFIYISSTGVYGQCDGEWVDESSPCHPAREGGRACLAAEEFLRAHALGSRAVILRLAGIYGPNRLPKLAQIKRGEPIESPATSLLNLIHVDDAVEVILAAEHNVQPPATLVVSDGHAVAREDFYRELARLLRAPPPKFMAPPPTADVSQRAMGNKRVNNARMLKILAKPLRFPTFREGLSAIVEG